MKILLTGHKGQLGRTLLPLLAEHNVVGVDLPEHDITDREGLTALAHDFGPDLILHPAAMTNVEGCARDPALAYRVNGMGTQNLALIAAELGAKVVKTYWCEKFEQVTNGCPVPVVIAGGPKCETELEVFEFVSDGMQRGAIGVNLGRNVWQNEHPVAMAGALRAIIHEDATPKEANELFNSFKSDEK